MSLALQLQILHRRAVSHPPWSVSKHAENSKSSSERSPHLPPDGGVDLLLRLVPDGAGVVNQHVRGAGVGGAAVPRRVQHTCHALRVRQVHLTAEGVDVVLLAVAGARCGGVPPQDVACKVAGVLFGRARLLFTLAVCIS